jgi:hypothetical protein
MPTAAAALMIALSCFVAGVAAAAQPYTSSDRAAIGAALGHARVTLTDGLTAAESYGTPVSARFEMDRGILQLSVYVLGADGKFSEVVVNTVTGKVTGVQPIAGLKLAAARAASRSLPGATVSLSDAVSRAERFQIGYRAVRIIPGSQNGKPIAEVTLARDKDFKAVLQQLY